jgi:hypothetical protein
MYVYIGAVSSGVCPVDSAAMHLRAGTQFTCFTGTKVQILTQLRLGPQPLHAAWRMLTCAHACSRMLTHAHVCLCCRLDHAQLDECWRMLTYADVCWRMLTYADVCWRMLMFSTWPRAAWRGSGAVSAAPLRRGGVREHIHTHTLRYSVYSLY